MNWDGAKGGVYPCDGPTRRICGRPVSASYPVQQRTGRVSCQDSNPQLHRIETVTRTEEECVTRLIPKAALVRDQVVICSGGVHVLRSSTSGDDGTVEEAWRSGMRLRV